MKFENIDCKKLSNYFAKSVKLYDLTAINTTNHLYL